MQGTAKHPSIAGNQNTSVLKLLALAFMLCDHTGVIFFPGVPIFRIIGRMALPLYAWCLIVGSEYTGNIWKYALRLLIVGAASQYLYMRALNHTWMQFNIFAVLLLGLLGIAGIQKKWYGSQVWAPLFALCATFITTMDYGWMGVLFIIVLYLARRDRCAIAAVVVSYCLFWGMANSSPLNSIAGIPLSIPGSHSIISRANLMLSRVFRMQSMAMLALPFILIRMDWIELRLPKWAGYALYPAHLLVLWLLKMCL